MYDEIGWNLKEKKKYKEALENFMKSEKLGKDSAFHFNCVAECYEQLKDFENAYFYFKKTKEKDTDNIELDIDIRKAAEKINKSEDAEKFLKSFNLDKNNSEK